MARGDDVESISCSLDLHDRSIQRTAVIERGPSRYHAVPPYDGEFRHFSGCQVRNQRDRASSRKIDAVDLVAVCKKNLSGSKDARLQAHFQRIQNGGRQRLQNEILVWHEISSS